VPDSFFRNLQFEQAGRAISDQSLWTKVQGILAQGPIARLRLVCYFIFDHKVPSVSSILKSQAPRLVPGSFFILRRSNWETRTRSPRRRKERRGNQKSTNTPCLLWTFPVTPANLVLLLYSLSLRTLRRMQLRKRQINGENRRTQRARFEFRKIIFLVLDQSPIVIQDKTAIFLSPS
jgi:hypothetical protein